MTLPPAAGSTRPRTDADDGTPTGVAGAAGPADAEHHFLPHRGDGFLPHRIGDGTRSRTRRSRRRRRLALRASIGVLLVLLAAAVPALGYLGYRTVAGSQGGQVLDPVDDPSAPGYQALVEPTPVALLAHVGEEGQLASLTLVSPGLEGAGGGAVFIPPDTAVAEPQPDEPGRLASAYQVGGIEELALATGLVVGTGFTEVIEIDDARWAELLGPVGPVTVSNPDPIPGDPAAGEPEVLFDAGEVTVAPDEVGRYLAARPPDVSDLNRLLRQQLFWEAWLEAVASSSDAAPAPGGPEAALAPFVEGLADGVSRLRSLPLEGDPELLLGVVERFTADPEEVARLMADLVPFPSSPAPGARVRTRLLSGLGGADPPGMITDSLVAAGAEITVIGNAEELGVETTRIQYHGETQEEEAEAFRFALGTGELELVDRVNDTIDVTVVLGEDVLGPVGAASAGASPD